jgi:hypothetical protein
VDQHVAHGQVVLPLVIPVAACPLRGASGQPWSSSRRTQTAEMDSRLAARPPVACS